MGSDQPFGMIVMKSTCGGGGRTDPGRLPVGFRMVPQWAPRRGVTVRHNGDASRSCRGVLLGQWLPTR